MSARTLGLAGAILIATLACGSSVTTRDRGPVSYSYVNVDRVPVDTATAPRAEYGGHTHYLYQDRWYFQDGPRWRTYTNEPGYLIERRQNAHSRRER